MLVDDGERVQQRSFVPCYDGVACAWWVEEEEEAAKDLLPPPEACAWGAGPEAHAMACLHVADVACASIVAGHFGTQLVEDIAQADMAAGESHCADLQKEDSRLASTRASTSWDVCGDPLQCTECLVVMREPIDRLIAAYTDFDDGALDRPFDTLSTAEMRHIALEYGNVALAYLGNGAYDPQNVQNNSKLSPSGGDMEVAKSTLRHCSIGIFDRWEESQQLWAKELPWSTLGNSTAHERPSKVAHVTHRDLNPEQVDALRSLLGADFELYQHATRIFDMRLHRLNLAAESEEEACGPHAVRASCAKPRL